VHQQKNSWLERVRSMWNELLEELSRRMTVQCPSCGSELFYVERSEALFADVRCAHPDCEKRFRWVPIVNSLVEH